MNIGQVFLGKYRVDAILGHGGMGVVAQCTHLALNERVAVKMLRQDVLLDHDAVQRFTREAQAAVKLKSEYVARVSDVGVFENGTPYMVMEFLEGMDLGEVLKERGVLPVPWATELMLQTAEALAEAHSLGIVHRDVKPTNLFVTWRPDGSALIKVLDFGISKSPMGTDMQLTQTQSLLGTPAYMSPEQMRSARLVDSRSDIWSLGTVFYEVLEGRRPFEAESFSEMCVKVAVDPPAPMVNTPPQLQAVIMRCLAKTPEQRYPSMADLARDLVPFVADPHSAVVLVERMHRMLRRSTAHDWEGGGTGVGRQALGGSSPAIPMRQATQPSMPQAPHPQQWGAGAVGTDPSGQPWRVKSDPAMKPYQDVKSGVVAALPQTFDTVSVRPKGRPLLIAALIIAIAGGGIAYSLATRSSKPAQQPSQVEPTQPAQQPEVKQPEVKQPEVKQPEVKVDTGSGAQAGSAQFEVKQVETKQNETKQVETKQNDTKQNDTKQNIHHVQIHTGGGTTTTKTGGGTTTTKTGGGTKTGPGTGTGTGTGSGSAVKLPPCDPYSSMHGDGCANTKNK